MSRPLRTRRALGGVLAAVVLVLWGFIAGEIATHIILASRGVETEGEIVGYDYEQRVRRPARSAWHPVYRFTTESGETVQVLDPTRRADDDEVARAVWDATEGIWQVPPTERVRIVLVYDPESPELVEPLADLEAGVGVMTWATGIVSLLLAAAAIAMLGGRGPRGAVPAPPRDAPAPRGEFTAASTDAHRDWVRAGRTGDGRLDVVGFDASEQRFDVLELSEARLTDVRLRHSRLEYSTLDDAVLTGCELRGANVVSVRLRRARLTHCSFENTHAMGLDALGAQLSECTFAGSLLDKSRWVQASCERTSFHGAQFGNSLFDGGHFVDCDFSSASFRPKTILPPVTMVGAVFEGCDFRDVYLPRVDLSGATFRECRFAGAFGVPAAADGLTLVHCDISPGDDDARVFVDAETLLELLATRSRWPVEFHATDDPRHPFAADDIEGQRWTVRLDDFPESASLYTLIVDGEPVESLMEWPAAWRRPADEASTPRTRDGAHDAHEAAAYDDEIARTERTSGIRPLEL